MRHLFACNKIEMAARQFQSLTLMNSDSLLKKKTLGKKYFIIKAPVKGGSMIPLIKEGSQLEVNLKPQQKIQTGDIVLFFKKGKLAAHRIIQKSGSKLILKGDNNRQNDGSFTSKNILGKIEKIIYPNYTINLNAAKNQLLKHFFVLYSRSNQKLPFLLKIKKLYHFPLLKSGYRCLLKSS